MSDYVHEDIPEKILHRLPPKSIGKCMAVCKSWNLLIKSHRFVSSYQQCSLSSTSLFLVHHSLEHYSICSPNIECWFSLPRMLSTYRFVGALNGLVCFATSYDRDGVIIVNPRLLLNGHLLHTHLPYGGGEVQQDGASTSVVGYVPETFGFGYYCDRRLPLAYRVP
ncbi:F-box/kelch-repeat protein At5g15710-like [Gastrolobium bilobum]|uniref:F-box/kelch-repeat protein At5g15710-like n=1 Tax=Gastrolobium bilobum TaxID=150636 RepID=UPI002AB2B946|nr:F-box/kelch-repeat protein At5g15710-like [Gastrolobium bilobum]